MTGAYKVKVTGDREVAAAFRKLGYKSSDLSEVFGRIASVVAADARSLAPKVSGRLAASIKPARYKTRAVISAGSSAVPYSGVQEYGWPGRNIRPQPFMRPAADSKADSSAEQIAAEMQRLINQAGLG